MLSTVSNSCPSGAAAGACNTAACEFSGCAEVLFAEIGYEATTMTAIAERSGSGIGTLYHYFPDKQSMAFALLNQYAQKVEAYWKPLIEQAETLSHTAFVADVPGTCHRIPKGTSACLQLLAAPIRFSRVPLRAGLCALLSRTPLERRPHRSPAKRLCWPQTSLSR